MDAKRFGCFVAERRKELGLTQKELAAKIQVTDKAVSKWERGLGLPDISTIEPLASALSVSIEELMRSEKDVLQAAEAEITDKKGIIMCTFAVTTLVLSLLEIFLSIKWDGSKLQMSASVPYTTFIPGLALIIYSIVCVIKGRKTDGAWALGLCLILIPVIVLGSSFLILGLIAGE